MAVEIDGILRIRKSLAKKHWVKVNKLEFCKGHGGYEAYIITVKTSKTKFKHIFRMIIQFSIRTTGTTQLEKVQIAELKIPLTCTYNYKRPSGIEHITSLITCTGQHFTPPHVTYNTDVAINKEERIPN
jgi:hypothetical protein